jgi:glycosyltransferase involved in cell wall biosynthesis
MQGQRVALLYSPGSLAIDCASGLLRGIERGLFELGAQVFTLNLALYKRHIRGGDIPYPPDSPVVTSIVDFLNEHGTAQKLDLCFGLFHDVYLSDAVMEALRRRCNKVINYPLNLLDQPHRFARALQFCDETFCSEEEALAPARKAAGSDAKVRYVPMAADPFLFRRLGDAPTPKLLFVGSFYADREWLLDQCAQELPVSAYGYGHDVKGVVKTLGRELVRRHRFTPPLQAARMVARAALRDGRHVADEEFVRLAAEHGVSVGFADVVQERTGKPMRKVRLREYEATMTGLCHLACRLPETQRAFVEGEEILFYDEPAQISGLLARIRRGEVDYKKIGRAARARAERDHTWTVRLRAALCS